MPGLHLYCLTPAGEHFGLEIAGVERNPVSALRVGPFLVWAHSAERPPSPTLEAIREHHEVVTATWQHASACLPARFGQWFPSEEALASDVLRRVADLERALAQVRGAAEHGVRVIELRPPVDEPDALPAPTSGRAYLEAARRREQTRAAREERSGRVAAALLEATGGCVIAQRASVLAPDEGLVSVAHLVPAGGTTQYGEALDRFRGEHAELSLIRIGPWPPYSFAE